MAGVLNCTHRSTSAPPRIGNFGQKRTSLMLPIALKVVRSLPVARGVAAHAVAPGQALDNP
jgi:hypothetical protein